MLPSCPHDVSRPQLWSGDVQLICSPPRVAVTNMALDDAMLAVAGEQNVTLVRLYSWDRPSVSFGRNQRCANVYSPERCEVLDVPAVRRPTGGRALVHGRELTYAVAAPNSTAPSLRGGYDAINAVLLEALLSMGVAAALSSPTERTAPPGLAPCFESPSGGELVVAGRKLVGSAQQREGRAFLQHGSILLDDDQGLLHDLALVPLPAVPAPATLRGCLGRAVETGEVADAICEALRHAVTQRIVVQSDAAIPQHHVDTATSRYRDPRWTWRR